MDTAAKSRLGHDAQPVRAILFDKRPGENWSVGWHQDRTIAVRGRMDVPGSGPWSRKSGIDHVEPSFEYIEGMITLSAHLDACGSDNAPLMIIPGSHGLGRIPVKEVERIVGDAGWSPVWPTLATSGSMLRLFSMHRIQPTTRRIGEFCTSTTPLPASLRAWVGLGSDDSS
jgi:hypothetical protein